LQVGAAADLGFTRIKTHIAGGNARVHEPRIGDRRELRTRRRLPSLRRRADIVAKRFWVSEEATLIQDQPTIRKVDSKICSLRFDCCARAAPRRLLQQFRPQPDSSGTVRTPSHFGRCMVVQLLPQAALTRRSAFPCPSITTEWGD
jgi:hypothetical protein